ncbi:hypothetical protein EST38_g11371 [Candolleomyces aberdarensis]|uniref:Uncharacterized protein n=1 Tax=Candolleomyces aberdarensis TaxID=2316362 RepID=A0A4Q2D509_9AGAR|nr:hypothetical protein EST38_g11371 [Candolleomyces aberdarensis]
MSEMKKLAARDYEDILQCSIPAFEGLLSNEQGNKEVTKLLYRAAEFHAFAKMRLHTDETLTHLETTAKVFGKQIRHFHDEICPRFDTFELPGETNRRNRQKARRGAATGVPTSRTQGRKRKGLNLHTYKFHSLGDYALFICLFGGTDSFSTQPGELVHKLVKRLYGTTNKCQIEKRIGKRVRRLERAKLAAQRRAQRLRLVQMRQVVHNEVTTSGTVDGNQTAEPHVEEDRDPRFYISPSRNSGLDLSQLMKENRGNPAYDNFVRKLKDHLLARLINRGFDGDAHDDFTDNDRNSVRIYGDKIYEVRTCRINYTTYDNRRDYDIVNPRTHPDVMVLSQEDNNDIHPFWYARVIGVFHARVMTDHTKASSKNWEWMPFLWVRWFGAEPGYTPSFRHARLPKIGFVQWEEEPGNYAFGFLDPAQVLRGCHLIPAFHSGRTARLLPHDCATARQVKSESADNLSTQDWTNYYVNIFVDRDMVMRHYGGGVGHQSHIQMHAVPLNDELALTEQDRQVDEEEPDDLQQAVELDIQEIDRELMEMDERGEDGEIDEEVDEAERTVAMDDETDGETGETDGESSDGEEGALPDLD